MANPSRRGQVGSEVSTSMQGAEHTPFANTHFILPYGLRLQQTINAGTTSVTIPAGITFVYAIAVGSGGAPNSIQVTASAGGGGVAWGWTLASPSCIVGDSVNTTGSRGNYTRYGNIIAGGGAGTAGTGLLGGGGSTTNYWGIPLAGAPVGTNSTVNGVNGGSGGSGISGGGGGSSTGTGSENNIGGTGGNGLVGGAGGSAFNSTATNLGGNGGNGINILTGQITAGGVATTANGAGGGGIAGDASGINGGLGGGAAGRSGASGAGILYLFY